MSITSIYVLFLIYSYVLTHVRYTYVATFSSGDLKQKLQPVKPRHILPIGSESPRVFTEYQVKIFFKQTINSESQLS